MSSTQPDLPATLERLRFSDILLEEQVAIDSEAFAPDSKVAIEDLYRKISERDRSALCLSGGGIRSAAFSLGVIQRLANARVSPRHPASKGNSQETTTVPMLCEFDYLSTVSGGGYIGSWISAWLYRTRNSILNEESKTEPVVIAINSRDDGKEPAPLKNLRKNSLYMAPHFGFASPDLWNDVACVIRNIALNWAVVLPPIALVVLLTQLFLAIFLDASLVTVTGDLLLAAIAVGAATLSVGYAALHIPTRVFRGAHKAKFLLGDLFCWMVASVAFLIICCRSYHSDWKLFGLYRVVDASSPYMTIAYGAVMGMVVYGATWIGTWAIMASGIGKTETTETSATPGAEVDRFWYRAPVSWVAAGGTFGALVATGLICLGRFAPSITGNSIIPFAIILLGPPALIAARLIGDTILAAGMERLTNIDVNLEWFSRAGGYFLLVALGWTVCILLIGLGPHVVKLGVPGATVLTFGTVLSGAISALIGWSSDTGPIAAVAKAAKWFSLKQLATIFAVLFAIGLFLLFGILFDRLFFDKGFRELNYHALVDVDVWTPIAAAVCLAVFSGISSYFVNINRFSLHGLYRNHLVRTFLGSSRNSLERWETRDPFTDYDGRDNLPMRDLWPASTQTMSEPDHNATKDWKPFHLINVTANFASSRDLALQERKAAPFSITPLHAGCAELGKIKDGKLIDRSGAYLSTCKTVKGAYGGPSGLSLGTAMAISGAAVSPNMGYFTSPGVSFLMALFNVRLGWWLANPAHPKVNFWRTSPSWSLKPLFQEMFGLTDEVAPWVLLSDGGHFDNTGLYEMVRRRCGLVVVVDGGADPECSFADLGRSTTKIEIDLGVRIVFKGLDQLKKRFGERPTPAGAAPYWAVADIKYSEHGKGCRDGLLLYIKAGLHGTEPVGILSYALANKQFPHDPTVNQFYGETQFEAYRALGYEAADKALNAVYPCSTAESVVLPAPTLREAIEKVAKGPAA